jgi:hypothetical protein
MTKVAKVLVLVLVIAAVFSACASTKPVRPAIAPDDVNGQSDTAIV